MLDEIGLGEVLHWNEDDIEQALTDVTNEEKLTALLGREGLDEARNLASKERRNSVHYRPRAYILPGVVGSKLGNDNPISDRLDSLIWLNPLRIRKKGLNDLALNSGKKIATFGIFQATYFLLHLHLRNEGYSVRSFAYDWRLSLKESADAFVRELGKDVGSDIHIIAHSMGGLLIRDALAKDPRRLRGVERIITLGTPHGGSFAPALLLEGTHRHLRTAASLADDEPKRLAENVFATMPGVYELLPSPAFFSNDLYDVSLWPRNGPRVSAELLASGRAAHETRSKTDERFRAIVGYGRETISGAVAAEGAFAYESTSDGDGAVLIKSAELPGVPTWFTTAEHGSLPNSRDVRRAIIDILEKDSTDALQRTPVRRNDSSPYRIESATRASWKADGLDEGMFRTLFSDFAAPFTSSDSISPRHPAPANQSSHSSAERASIFSAGPGARGRQFEIGLFGGDITLANTRAYATCIFEGVKPGGATAAIDKALEGRISALAALSDIDGRQGAITIALGAKARLAAEIVYLVGVGRPGLLTEAGVAAATRSLVRRLIIDGIEDCAIVPFATSSGLSIADGLKGAVSGALTAIEEFDGESSLRSLVICEWDRARFAMLKSEIWGAIRQTPLKTTLQIRVVVRERFQEAPAERQLAETMVSRRSIAHIVATATRNEASGSVSINYNVVSADISASYAVEEVEVSREVLEIMSSSLDAAKESDPRDVQRFQDEFARRIAPASVKKLKQEEAVVVIHNDLASRFNWELLRTASNRFPALEGGLSRQLGLPPHVVNKATLAPKAGDPIRILIIANPTNNLAGAQEETDALVQLLSTKVAAGVDFRILRKSDASRSAVLPLMSTQSPSGWHILHYAGHASFNAENPRLSGLDLSDGKLTGEDIERLTIVPPIVFLNGCETAKIRREKPRGDTVRGSASLAKAFIAAGVKAFIGTYWPVGDKEAKEFSKAYYESLFAGQPVGAAVVAGRRAIDAMHSIDWANYLFFGDYDWRIER